MNIFVLFGITGDLARKKVIPALAEIEKGSGLSRGDQLAIGIGRKKQPPEEFSLIKKSKYITGELDAVSTYKKLKKELYTIARMGSKTEVINVIAYSSLPPHLHVAVARLFAKHAMDQKLNKKCNIRLRFLFEKPIGTDLATAIVDISELQKIFTPDQLYFVDHYLFKESLMTLRKAVELQPEMFANVLGSSGVTAIESIMYEDVDVRGRGAFFDVVGSLNDTGQNHLLQMLAVGIQMREKAQGKKPKSRAQIISSLKIVNNPIFGQYKGYTEVDGVKPGSQTETFFRIEAMYKDLKCIISGGKALGITKSGLILKNQKHGTELFIDMSLGKKDAYISVFEQAILGNQHAFAREEEIIAGWKFVKRAKQIKTRKNSIYQDMRDIIDMI
jgi:glucose-6-phosphate 1-dehydrogenase